MILNLKRLTDGTERLCIHWLVESSEGSIETQPNTKITERGAFKLGGVKGYIACNPKQNSVNPQHRGQEVMMCLHTNEIRAVTCPKCLDTAVALNHELHPLNKTIEAVAALG